MCISFCKIIDLVWTLRQKFASEISSRAQIRLPIKKTLTGEVTLCPTITEITNFKYKYYVFYN